MGAAEMTSALSAIPLPKVVVRCSSPVDRRMLLHFLLVAEGNEELDAGGGGGDDLDGVHCSTPNGHRAPLLSRRPPCVAHLSQPVARSSIPALSPKEARSSASLLSRRLLATALLPTTRRPSRLEIRIPLGREEREEEGE